MGLSTSSTMFCHVSIEAGGVGGFTNAGGGREGFTPLGSPWSGSPFGAFHASGSADARVPVLCLPLPRASRRKKGAGCTAVRRRSVLKSRLRSHPGTPVNLRCTARGQQTRDIVASIHSARNRTGVLLFVWRRVAAFHPTPSTRRRETNKRLSTPPGRCARRERRRTRA